MTEFWTLVFINIMFNVTADYDEPVVEGFWTYNTMIECFHARSQLGQSLSGHPGYFPEGTQAVCIKSVVEPL